jgi:hypothetical protein
MKLIGTDAMSLTDPLFTTQTTRLALALAAALDDPQLQTEIDTTRFRGAHHDTAVQANRMLDRLREQTKAAHNLWDTWNRGRAATERLSAKLAECRARCERLAASERAHTRARAALESISARTMIVDEAGTIVSIHPALAATLHEIRSDLDPALKGLEAESVVGRHISLFFSEPPGRHGAAPSHDSARRTALSIGRRQFELTIRELHDGAGAHIGTVVEWHEGPRSAEGVASSRECAQAACLETN